MGVRGVGIRWRLIGLSCGGLSIYLNGLVALIHGIRGVRGVYGTYEVPRICEVSVVHRIRNRIRKVFVVYVALLPRYKFISKCTTLEARPLIPRAGQRLTKSASCLHMSWDKIDSNAKDDVELVVQVFLSALQ